MRKERRDLFEDFKADHEYKYGHFDAEDRNGVTLLMAMAQTDAGYNDMIALILKMGADVNKINKFTGETVLLSALRYRRSSRTTVPFVRTLLNSGASASINQQEYMHGRSALSYACRLGSPGVVAQLIEAGASTLIVEHNGCSLYENVRQTLDFFIDLADHDSRIRSWKEIICLIETATIIEKVSKMDDLDVVIHKCEKPIRNRHI